MSCKEAQHLRVPVTNGSKILGPSVGPCLYASVPVKKGTTWTLQYLPGLSSVGGPNPQSLGGRGRTKEEHQAVCLLPPTWGLQRLC